MKSDSSSLDLRPETDVVVHDAPAAGAVGGVDTLVAGFRAAFACVLAVAERHTAALAGRAGAWAAPATFAGHARCLSVFVFCVCLCVSGHSYEKFEGKSNCSCDVYFRQ